jgi:hypothetical protein
MLRRCIRKLDGASCKTNSRQCMHSNKQMPSRVHAVLRILSCKHTLIQCSTYSAVQQALHLCVTATHCSAHSFPCRTPQNPPLINTKLADRAMLDCMSSCV